MTTEEDELQSSSSATTQQQGRQQKRPQQLLLSERVPLPASVEIWNLWPLDSKMAVVSPPKRFFRPEYTSALLHRVRLSLIVIPPIEAPEMTTPVAEESKALSLSPNETVEQILVSRVNGLHTVHPKWSHINEAIVDQLNNMDEGQALKLYESMILRFTVEGDDPREDSTTTTTESSSYPGESPTTTPTVIPPPVHFLQVPVYPNKLMRLAQKISPSSTARWPVNMVVVTYTDQSVRILPSHYQLLLEHGPDDLLVASKNRNIPNSMSMPSLSSTAAASVPFNRPASPNSQHFDPHLNEFGRFEDNVFRTLDQVQPARLQSNKRNGRTNDFEENAIRSDHTRGVDPSRSTDKNFFLARKADNGHHHDQTDPPHVPDESEELVLQLRIDADKVDKDRLRLEEAIRQEETALAREVAELQESQHHLLIRQQELHALNQQTQHIRDATRDEIMAYQKLEFVLEGQRIRLLLELKTIYPITVVTEPKMRHLIRGLEIPEVFGSVPDDETSAALGYLCHLTILMSKYLGVDLRYRLLCQLSRSAIQDDHGNIFPLFHQGGRNVDRDLLDQGFALLERNVNCICRARGIAVDGKRHILAKVQRLYEQVIDGH